MTFAPPIRKPPPGRLVACARCGQLVAVWGHVPARFIGSCCLVPVREDSFACLDGEGDVCGECASCLEREAGAS